MQSHSEKKIIYLLSYVPLLGQYVDMEYFMLSIYRQAAERSFFRKKYFSVCKSRDLLPVIFHRSHREIFLPFYFALFAHVNRGQIYNLAKSNISNCKVNYILCFGECKLGQIFFQSSWVWKKDMIYLAYRGQKLTCNHRRGTFTALMTRLIFTRVAKPIY